MFNKEKKTKKKKKKMKKEERKNQAKWKRKTGSLEPTMSEPCTELW